MTSQPDACPFCNLVPDSIIYEDELVAAFWDVFPVSPGHALLVPKRHVCTWFDANQTEQVQLLRGVDRVRQIIEQRYSPSGYNIGVNVGQAAGQTVFHLHLHVIPRYEGDTPDPTGGVRHVIPEKANYRRGRGFVQNLLGSVPHHRSLIRGLDDPLLPHLLAELDRATSVDIAVAFIQKSGVRPLLEHLRDLLNRNGRLRLLTGDYLDITDPEAILALIDRSNEPHGTVELRVFEADGTSFHPKAYLFYRHDGSAIAYVGSSNLSESALRHGVEWNYRVVSSDQDPAFSDVADAFEQLFQHTATRSIDVGWIQQYRARRRPPSGPAVVDVSVELPESPPEPHEIQREALCALYETRQAGNAAGLVVLATGLGKTWLAAFDSQDPAFEKVLFVAHREEILSQAMRTFRRIRPTAVLGRYTGKEKRPKAEVLFASIQTLGRRNHLQQFEPEHFDYIVVDEFHHAAARSYRGLIEYFTPKFLLGLTATPERMDGGDLLALCQENLVYRRDVIDGINAGLLCPFHYYGVPDDVDYSNIPWRSSRFDEEALTLAVATKTRAENALQQYRDRAGKRTLCFCCSQRHADYMADHFCSAGLKAVAVHAGPASGPRASSLEQLEAGELDAIFAVDMFNEGVDLPQVDTVMMLRPTESNTIWLQQFGRGLRNAEGKNRLTVIDYIGNHRTFLTKARALLQPLMNIGPGDREISVALQRILKNDVTLPKGCEVTYELEAVNIINSLLRKPRAPEAIKAYYIDFRERHGERPRAVELLHEGYNPKTLRKSHGSWLRFVRAMSDLTPAQQRVLEEHGDFLDAVEVTEMNRSFKMLVMQSLLSTNQLPGEMDIQDLTKEFSRLAGRSATLRREVAVPLDDLGKVIPYLEKNPITAWVDGKGTGGHKFFKYQNGRFASTFAVGDELRADFQELTRELIEWRLAEYVQRDNVRNRSENRLVCRVIHASRRPIIKLPDRENVPGVPIGWTDVMIEGQPHEAKFAKQFLNVVRVAGSEDNVLPDILRNWFGPNAGMPGTRYEVTIDSVESGYLMAPANAAPADLKAELWRHYLRERIPPLFGFEFNPGIWNSGFVTRPGHIFLLVTLEKGTLSASHRYEDRFESPSRFVWQSQNRSTRTSKHAQQIHDHQQLGIDVHLFVRRCKTIDGKAAPFIYCGEVDFQDWQGDAPITVTWRLQHQVPSNLFVVLDVPDRQS